MKVVVIQEELLQSDITKDELTERWMKLEEIPEVDDLQIVKPVPYPLVSEISELTKDADAAFGIWIGPDIINKEFVDSHPKLKYIGMLGHGYEPFDKNLAIAHGLHISNTVYGASTISEYGFALLMEVCHHVNLHSNRVHNIDWSDPNNKKEYCRTETRQIELFGKTMGIVGLGAIGFSTAKIAAGFGMKVISYSRHKKVGPEYDFIDQKDSLHELLAESDVVSLNVPHTKETEHMINRKTLGEMKDGAILINTARGALIDEEALADALRSGKLYGAGLDVLTDEPPVNGSPLLSAPNCTITGHIAWLTRESRLRAVYMAIDQFKSYLKGNPVSLIA